jgi:hypothetical protein
VTNNNLQAQIDAANAYETLFVPALFRQWTTRVADAAQIKPGERVLDVSCGTGTLAREHRRVRRGRREDFVPFSPGGRREAFFSFLSAVSAYSAVKVSGLTRISLVLQKAEDALRSYASPEGKVEFALSAHIVTAAKPRA